MKADQAGRNPTIKGIRWLQVSGHATLTRPTTYDLSRPVRSEKLLGEVGDGQRDKDAQHPGQLVHLGIEDIHAMHDELHI